MVCALYADQGEYAGLFIIRGTRSFSESVALLSVKNVHNLNREK